MFRRFLLKSVFCLIGVGYFQTVIPLEEENFADFDRNRNSFNQDNFLKEEEIDSKKFKVEDHKEPRDDEDFVAQNHSDSDYSGKVKLSFNNEILDRNNKYLKSYSDDTIEKLNSYKDFLKSENQNKNLKNFNYVLKNMPEMFKTKFEKEVNKSEDNNDLIKLFTDMAKKIKTKLQSAVDDETNKQLHSKLDIKDGKIDEEAFVESLPKKLSDLNIKLLSKKNDSGQFVMSLDSIETVAYKYLGEKQTDEITDNVTFNELKKFQSRIDAIPNLKASVREKLKSEYNETKILSEVKKKALIEAIESEYV